MRSWHIFVAAVIFTCSIYSCYSPRYVYSPVAHNVPVLAKKGDSKLAFFYASNLKEKATINGIERKSSSSGIDVQGAYAITNHFAVQAAYSRRSEKNFADFNINSPDTSTINYTRNLTELGVGYFTFISGNKQSIFQVFAGVGIGKSSFADFYEPLSSPAFQRFFKMNVTRLYLQPAFMIRYKNTFATSLSSRFSVVYFKNISTDYSEQELESYQLKALGNGANIFWEPAFVNTVGFKKLPGLQFELQLGMAFLMTRHFVDYRTFNLSAGIVLDMPELFKGKKQAPKN